MCMCIQCLPLPIIFAQYICKNKNRPTVDDVTDASIGIATGETIIAAASYEPIAAAGATGAVQRPRQSRPCPGRAVQAKSLL